MSLEFNRKNVSNKAGIVDFDPETGVDLFCYKFCDDNSDDITKRCRGVVFDGDQLIMESFPYTTEINNSDVVSHVKNLDDWNMYDSREGTLVRFFYHKKKWYISTHRKLNAFKSKWSSRKSFGEMFIDALQSGYEKYNDTLFSEVLNMFEDTLNTENQYMFLLTCGEDNRIVCDTTGPQVYHVGTFIDGKLDLNDDINIAKQPLLTFTSIDELVSYVSEINYSEKQGVICFNKNNNSQLKIINSNYQMLFDIRGNEPSIKFRYLQLRNTQESVDMLLKLYPHMNTDFDNYETILSDITTQIYKAYVDRFIKKQFVVVPKEQYNVTKECHSHYLRDPYNNRITREVVRRFLDNQPPTNLNKMIKCFKIGVKKIID